MTPFKFRPGAHHCVVGQADCLRYGAELPDPLTELQHEVRRAREAGNLRRALLLWKVWHRMGMRRLAEMREQLNRSAA